jgi:N-acetylneuraminic acid mutarotase
LGDGKVLVAGSQEAGVIFSDNFQLNSAELYDPATSSWSAAPSMIVGRSHHTATLLNDKTALVVGGVTDIYCDDVNCSVKTVASSAELFTP